MRQILFISFLSVLLSGNFLYGQTILKGNIYFDYGKYSLTEKATSNLNKVFQRIQQCEDCIVELDGHTDAHGSNSYNEKLSQNRTQAVKSYLVDLGVAEDKIRISYFGEDKPVKTNETDRGRAVNRRVHVALTKEKQYDIQELYGMLKNETQWFSLNPRIDNWVKGEQGTVILIPKNTFECGGRIDFGLDETYSQKDMLFNNLSTTSGNQLLESRGMLYTQAKCEEKPANMKNGKELSILMPVEDDPEGMTLFRGEMHDSLDSPDWVLDRDNGYRLPRVRGGSLYRYGWVEGVDTVKVYYKWPKRTAIRLANQVRPTSNRRKWYREEPRFSYRFDPEQYEKAKAERLEAFRNNMDALKSGGLSKNVKRQMSYYAFASANLGFINCDRFYSVPAEDKQVFSVNLKAGTDTDVKLVFRSANAVMQGSCRDGGYSFFDVPTGMEVTIVALRWDKDGAHLATLDTRVSDESNYDLEFETYKDFDLLRDKLAALTAGS